MDLIGLLIFFVILAVATPTIIYMQQHSLMELRSSVAAEQLNTIVKAANSYVQANYYSIESAGGSVQLSVEQLQNDGFLPQDMSASTPYGGTWNVQIQSPNPGYLDGLISANGGLPLNQAELGTIIAQTHGVGGEVPPLNFEIDGNKNTGTVAYGAYGGWSLSLSGYQNPGPGHIVGLLDYYNGSNANNDYLYRASIPNHPELNSMQTNLDMGDNIIGNINTIQTGQPTVASQCVRLDSEGHCIGQIMAASTSESNLPTGWWGGILTRDLYAQDGAIAVGPGQVRASANGVAAVDAYINDAGNTVNPGGRVYTTSPNWEFSTTMSSTAQSATVFTVNRLGTTSAYMTTSPTSSYIQTLNTSGANTYIYANDDGNPQDTGLNTDGSIILGHDQNGVCSSNSKIYIAGSQLYDGCDGNLHLNPGGGDGNAAIVAGSIKPAAIATSGNYCPVDGYIATNTQGSIMSCVNNVWTAPGGLSQAHQDFNWFFGTSDTGWHENTSGHMEYIVGISSTTGCGVNGYQATAYVSGQGMVDSIQNNNLNWYKNGTINFFVPNGQSWDITSNPWNGCQPTVDVIGTSLY